MPAESKTEIKGANPQDLALRVRNILAGYRAEFQRDVSTNDAHIYWSAPLSKWIMTRKRGLTVTLSFHKDCPCSEI